MYEGEIKIEYLTVVNKCIYNTTKIATFELFFVLFCLSGTTSQSASLTFFLRFLFNLQFFFFFFDVHASQNTVV